LVVDLMFEDSRGKNEGSVCVTNMMMSMV